MTTTELGYYHLLMKHLQSIDKMVSLVAVQIRHMATIQFHSQRVMVVVTMSVRNFDDLYGYLTVSLLFGEYPLQYQPPD